MTVIAPMPVRTAVWPAVFVWPLIAKPETVSVLSTSESLVRTLPVTVASSVAVAVSARATGASLTAVTVSVSVEVEVAAPSESV